MGSKILERLPGGYSDLNIQNGPNSQAICETAIKFGYKILAINTTIIAKNPNAGQGGSKKAAKKRKLDENSTGESIPVPDSEQDEWIKRLEEENPGIRILKRLTLIFSVVNNLQVALLHPNSKLYDIIGVIPSNHDAMQGCIVATNMIFDIISFDFEGPYWINKLKLNRTKGVLASEKGIFFEVTYTSSLHGDASLENLIYIGNCLLEDICVKRIKKFIQPCALSLRRETFQFHSHVQSLYFSTRQNMIITSGAKTPIEIRKPKDVFSMAYLLGLDETTARHCIREYTHRIVSKADLRKFGKTWVAFIPSTKSKNSIEEKEQGQKDLSSFSITSSSASVQMGVEEEKNS